MTKPKPSTMQNNTYQRGKGQPRGHMPGLCLFCNKTYPRGSHCYSLNKFTERIPKNRRCFNFLSTSLGVTQPYPNGFNFISEVLPLCSNCLELFDQLHFLQLKAQAIKFQINMQIDEIRSIIVNSKILSSDKQSGQSLPPELGCEENHFDVFRRQIKPKNESETNTKDELLPEIRLTRLTEEEINKFKRTPVTNTNKEFFKPEPISNPPSPSPSLEDLDSLEIPTEFDSIDQTEENNISIDTNVHIIINVKSIPSNGTELAVEFPVQIQTISDNEFRVPCSSNIVIDEPIDFEMESTNCEEQPLPSSSLNTSIPEPNQQPSTTTITETALPKKRQRRKFPKDPGDDDCKVCDEKFKSTGQLASHYKLSHPGKFPFHCPDTHCEYACYDRPMIRRHFSRRHGPIEEREKNRKFGCDLCPKAYFFKKELDYHKRTHEGSKPFKCEQCEKSFRQKQALEIHAFRIHENRRDFACPHCEWKFKDKYSLRDHIAIHTGNKNYVCHICGTKRIQQFAMKAHFEVHRKRGEWVDPPKPQIKYLRRQPYRRPVIDKNKDKGNITNEPTENTSQAS